jgi:probable HAF family extracellular repeat protein
MRTTSLTALMLGCLAATLPIVAQPTVSELAFSGDFSSAEGINDRGEIAGSVAVIVPGYPFDEVERQMVLWTERDGALYLGRLNGRNTWAEDVNARGEIAGSVFVGFGSFGSQRNHALRWTRREGMFELQGQVSDAYGVNDRGEVVGKKKVSSGPWHAFVWTEQDGMRDIGTLGGQHSSAYDINNRGEVAGAGQLMSWDWHAFVWSERDGMRDLGTLGGPSSWALGINNRGEVVGKSQIASGQWHAFIWTEQDGMRDLGEGAAHAINERGDVVGVSGNSWPSLRAFLWNERDGMVMLPTLDGPCEANDINNRGEIVGYCGWRAVVWRP